MPRTAPRQFSRRNCRGAGWHKRGYRSDGNMWINVKTGSYGATRGMEINERSTITDLIEEIWESANMCDGYPIPEGWAFEVQFRRRALELSDEPVCSIFDGGETVITKVFDEEGEQRVFNGVEWTYHVPNGGFISTLPPILQNEYRQNEYWSNLFR